MKVKTFRQSRADGIRRPASCCEGGAQRYSTPREVSNVAVLGSTSGEGRDSVALIVVVSDASNRT